MKNTFLLFALLSVVAAGNYGKRQDAGKFTAATVENGKYRYLEIDEVPAQNPRFISITGIEAKGDNNNAVVDAVQFNMTTYNESTLSFGYIHEAAQHGGQTAQLAAFFFAFRSYAIFEFLNRDGVPGFQQTTGLNADVIITWYDLSSPALQWKPLVLNSTVLQDASGTSFKVSYVEAETLDEVFFVRFIVTERPIYVGNVLVTADKSKIDFGIKYYNPLNVPSAWSSGPSNLTNANIGYAAVTLSASLFADFKNGTASGANQSSSVAFGSGGVVGSFDWVPTAETHVQGVVYDGAVYAHVTDESNKLNTQALATFSFKLLFFSFEYSRPDLIYWDPIFGADINYALFKSSSSPLVFSFTVILAFVVTLL